MARKVKCFETGEYGTNETFFHAPDKHYYKSEEVYLERLRRVEIRKQIMDKIAELVGYEKGQKFPTVVTKKLKELDHYGNDIILETLCDCEKDILWAFTNKDFDTDYGKCAYMMSIVVNHINDVVNRKKREEKQQKIIEAQSKNIQFEEVDNDNINIQHTKNISRFVGEDDLWN